MKAWAVAKPVPVLDDLMQRRVSVNYASFAALDDDLTCAAPLFHVHEFHLLFCMGSVSSVLHPIV